MSETKTKAKTKNPPVLFKKQQFQHLYWEMRITHAIKTDLFAIRV